MEVAAATGNISAIINQIVDASALTGDDYINNSIGNLRFTYYFYLDYLHTRPKDLIDLVDGVLYIECKAYITKLEREKIERQIQEHQK